uniref:Ras-GEF domain-containing protein n=2 Tax=Homalodisca TaxID=139475 RepID=A0A1B6ILL5_9HEMI
MAKMRYSEMSKDISCDSLSTLRLIEEQSEKRNRDCDGNSSKAQKNNHSIESPKRISRTSTSETINNSLPCYDNLGAMGVQNKSQSLPSHVSLKSMDQLILEALRVSPEDLASQLTLLDLAVFCEIAPDELMSCAWNKKNKLVVAPNVVAFTKRFNHVSFWTVQEVLSGTSPKHRAEILSHFIKISKKLYELNNFHSLFAVISALQSVSVYRLTKTWNHISKKDKSTFDKLAEVFSDTNNWQNLREHMENLKLPCIPYLGVFLTDLVYIDMAHPHLGGLEPEQRKLKMNNILRIVSNLQQSRYTSLSPLPHIQRYLHSVRYIDELQKFVEDDQYKLSLKLEPPSPVPSSSSSRESVSDMMTVASLNLSPAKAALRLQPVIKFVPGHRKCRSLGTNVFNKPCGSRPLHLLDDSVLEESGCGGGLGLLSHSTHLAPASTSQDEACDTVSLQGCLRRKTVLKDGRKPTVAAWQRYWVQLWATALVFYLPKTFKGCERSDFKRDPCKMTPLSGCLVTLGHNPLHSDVFLIRDPHRSNMYKFKAISEEAALVWYNSLQQMLTDNTTGATPTNLISFD